MNDGDRLLAAALQHPREFDWMFVLADCLEEYGGEACPAGCEVPSPCTDGVHRVYKSAGPDSSWVICPACNGTGRTDAALEALGWRLLAGERRWPRRAGANGALWWRRARAEEAGTGAAGPETLPEEVFDFLAGGVVVTFAFGKYRDYDDPAVALADAARAYAGAWLAGWRPKEAQRG